MIQKEEDTRETSMNNSDELESKNALGKTIARYGKVSGAVGGLASKVIGEKYLGLKIKREEHADQLLAVLGNLKGPLMKIGQILATVPEALPPEYATALQQLQSSAPPMGWSFVKRRMRAELGNDWQKKFKSFGREAVAAASLGQVHKAVLHDGRVLACKLQYPDMRTAVTADLNQLKIMFSIYGKYDKSVETSQVYKELAARLYEELDYELEARSTKMYRYMLRNENTVHVPEVIDELSTDRLLSVTWLEGESLLSYTDTDSPLEQRSEIAMNLFRAWYVPLYDYGIIHGDPHPGNYTVCEDNSLNLLDFGCIRVFPAKFIGGIIELYHSLMEDDFDKSVHAYETWGFKGLGREHVEVLNIWARFLYAPVMDDRVRTMGEVTKGIYGRDTAREVHKRLKKLGGVSIPQEFVFMDRAAFGLGSIFLRLKAEINWYRLFNELIEGFDVETLERRQEETLKKFNRT